MIRRYEAHLESGDHILREGSQQEIGRGPVDYFREIDPETGQIYTNGYLVAPGGIGKTISAGDFFIGINTMPNGRYVLGDAALGKRVLVAVPTNQLADQWGDRLLGKMDTDTGVRDPSVFGDRFSEETVGIYHAGLSDEDKRAVLQKAIVIAVHDSIQILHAHTDPESHEPDPLIRPEDFDAVWIDEVDDRVRGDATSRFYKEVFFPNCLTIGCTATQLFRSGRTIGDYLFGGKTPICEITHQEAVQRREIAPHINIIVQPEIDASSTIRPRTNRWDDYSEAEQMRFIEQTGSDLALLDVIRKGRHPRTGKPLKEMMQLHQAVNIEHGIHITKMLNDAFGRNYAEVVWGDMDQEAHDLVKWAFENKLVTAVVQCKLWGRGTDFPPLELTVQHAPSLSPGKIVQFHTRASRRDDGRKSAIYLSPHIEGIDQLVVGELLGGLYMIPDGYEFPPTTGKHGHPVYAEPWPEIEGVKVFYTQRQLEMFAQERQRQRYVNGLPVKSKNMLAVDDMAQILGIDPALLHDRVYGPLQEAYEKRQARERFVNIEVDRQDVLHVRGRMFPVWRMGNYQHKGREVFCVDENLIPLCEHALYGRLDRVPPEALDRANIQRLLSGSEQQIGSLWQALQHAFFHRRPYERHAEIKGVVFSHDDFGFYRNQQGVSEFFLLPDALVPAYRHVHGADERVAKRWAEQPFIRQCKTSAWYTQANVFEALEINPIGGGREATFVQNLFDNLRVHARGMRVGDERTAEIGRGRSRRSLLFSKRWLPLVDSSDQVAICIHQESLGWLKNELSGPPRGMDNRIAQTAAL